MNPLPAFTQGLQMVVAVAGAPLLVGWIDRCRAWLQNRSAPSLVLPYHTLRKLFLKEALVAENASALFLAAPYLVFGTMGVAAAIIPSISSGLPLDVAADGIALVGLLASGRVFLALAAMDIGTPFGSLGARREMMIGFLAEPALLMVIVVAALISHSTSLSTITADLAGRSLGLDPSLAFTGIAFTIVLLAENGRMPVDNPATHLELTMIHEATLLEYSGRHLALMEWGSALKLFNYACIGCALFVPWGVASIPRGLPGLGVALICLVLKLTVVGAVLALIETLSAKLRVFRAPEFLANAFLFAVLGLLVHLLLASKA